MPKEKKAVDEWISKLMKGVSSKGGHNKIATVARGLNSIPGLITTLLISPYILGWVIPRFTYKKTRESNKRQMENENNKLKVSA